MGSGQAAGGRPEGDGPAPAVPRRASTRSVTLRDVAARAGVSSQTVSRVLRVPDEVAPHTRARVEDAIRESGYVPNLAARNLASNRSKIVATVVPALGSELFSETLTGLSAVLFPEGYQLLLGYTDYDDEREEDLIRSLLGRRPDGICLTGTVHRESTVAMLRTAGVPVVETWDWTDRPVDTLVGFSNDRAMYAMVSFLHESGYRDPCFVGSLLPGDHRSLRRLEGFRRAVGAFRLGREPRVVDASEYPLTLESGARLLAAARRAHPEADVLVFSTDVLACGALLAAGDAGLRVPRDIAVTGFGDIELSRMIRPKLTTVSLPNARIGREAATLLLHRMRGGHPAVPALDLGFEIRPRAST